MSMISVLSVCCCALLNFDSFIPGHFLSFFLSSPFLIFNFFCFVFLFMLLFCFAYSFKWNKEVLEGRREGRTNNKKAGGEINRNLALWWSSTLIPQFSSVTFSSRRYQCARKSPYALHPVSQKFPQRCLWNGSNIRLIDDGPLSPFQGRSSSASSFKASLLQGAPGVQLKNTAKSRFLLWNPGVSKTGLCPALSL